MGSCNMKENHIGSADIEILRFRQSERDPDTYMQGWSYFRNENDIESVEWDNGELKVGDTVYLAPSAVTKLKAKPNRFAKVILYKKIYVCKKRKIKIK